MFALWLWLSNRFEDALFPGRDKVHSMARQLCVWMDQGLTVAGALAASTSKSSSSSSSTSSSVSSSIIDSDVVGSGTVRTSSSSESDGETLVAEGLGLAGSVDSAGGSRSSNSRASMHVAPSNSSSSSDSSSRAGSEGVVGAVGGHSRGELSSESESDWEDFDSGAADGAPLKLHVVHHHHGLHHGADSSDTSDTVSSGSSGDWLQKQQHEPWPWVAAMMAAAKDGSFEEQLQPKMHSSMISYVRFKEGIMGTRLVVPKQSGDV